MTGPVIKLAERSRALEAQPRERQVEFPLQPLADPASPKVAADQDAEIQLRVAAHQQGEAKTQGPSDALEEARRIAP